MSAHMCGNEQTWECGTPRSQSNAFDWKTAIDAKKPVKKKTKKSRANPKLVNAFLTAPMPELSAKAKKALMVPANRIGVTLPGSGDPSRIPAIPQAYRGK